MNKNGHSAFTTFILRVKKRIKIKKIPKIIWYILKYKQDFPNGRALLKLIPFLDDLSVTLIFTLNIRKGVNEEKKVT